jgi:4-amino-4-deoxy-L-arabinose transferase-like glycosyltransferase
MNRYSRPEVAKGTATDKYTWPPYPRTSNTSLADPHGALDHVTRESIDFFRDAYVRSNGRLQDFINNLPPLVFIVGLQVALTYRLIHTDTAFADEALYLWAGHIEIANLLHGTPIPPFPTYFSGAPVIYPLLGAIADSIGGLAGARLLSLCFMVGVTLFLWSVTRQLFDRQAAFFGSAIFAVLGPTQHLGAFATYDAMSLFFLSLAAWIVIRAGTREDGWTWMILAALALTIANATKYASTIFDPVVIMLAVTAVRSRHDKRQTIGRAVVIMAYMITAYIILIVIATIGNKYYLTGITVTTLARVTGTTPPAVVLREAWRWTEILGVAAAIGLLLILRARNSWNDKFLALILAGAGLLAPVEQARIHTDTSLIKHTDFGAWFASILAGYAISRILSWFRFGTLRILLAGAAALLLSVPAYIGAVQATSFYSWPNATQLIKTIRPLVETTHGPILFQNPQILEYYLGTGIQWEQISGIYGVRLAAGKVVGNVPVSTPGDPIPYVSLVKQHYFKLIMLNDFYQDRLDGAFDQRLIYLLYATPGYHVVSEVPWDGGYFIIWRYGTAENSK